MSKLKIFAALLLLPAALCQASSLAMLSGSVSASLTEISGSISNSSRSSSNAVKQAEGDYKVTAVAEAAGQPDRQRLALQPADPARPGLYLTVAATDLAGLRIQPGDIVTAHPHDYGVAFTRQGGAHAFAVVLNDVALKELAPAPVTL